MSIYLFPSKNYGSANYSTNLNETNKIQSRVFQSYRKQSTNSTSRGKAYNMNDQEKRLKRDHSALYRQSKQQSALFEKGVKKVTPNFKQTSTQNTIKRSYRNKETYNVIEPSPVIETKFNEGGVRKIYLYDQRKESNPLRASSESRKKYVKEFNKQTEQKNDSGTYFVKKLSTHKNSNIQWHNQMTTVNLKKKQNIPNQQNSSNIVQEVPKKPLKQATKNISSMVSSTAGITLKQQPKNQSNIDFQQDYFRKYSRLDSSRHSKSGYLSSRCR